ncbi:flagellar motor switch protein FliN [Oxobacter pfennigii]|uniref:Flagellar motor switch protein FliN n=1 Tax=Oxobacter pfennigii TaxID=36849 RepID=A0A0P8X1G4_9CLOT|nr:flagellar motor switch phosphatase FliY [Oxobacter pfennigii]KPU44658.1 flagellar motor switch protein FliN [Oxobacter pfennigii]
MSNDFLSQEEIDALLSGAAESAVPEEEDLDAADKDLLGEIGNICMGSASTTLSILINQAVSITTPKVSLTTLRKMKESFQVPNIAIEVKFSSGLGGANLLVLKVPDAAVIADLMMGGSGVYAGGELSEIHMSAVSEAMNQMIGSAATSMATMFSREVNITPPNAILWDDNAQKLSNTMSEDEKIIQVAFRLTVGNLIDSEIMQILPVETGRSIIEAMTATYKEDSKEPQSQPVVEQVVDTKVSTEEEVPVHKAQFMPFEAPKGQAMPKNIDLILDVPIEVSVILGRTRKTIKEILELNTGSLIELDKLVEEPVEILINGKKVAEGEVVVVNENFGIRITNIISNVERVKNLRN